MQFCHLHLTMTYGNAHIVLPLQPTFLPPYAALHLQTNHRNNLKMFLFFRQSRYCGQTSYSRTNSVWFHTARLTMRGTFVASRKPLLSQELSLFQEQTLSKLFRLCLLFV